MQELYARYKKLLFTLAYQLTGSVSDAEDAVQEVFLKLHNVNPERLTHPKAYLCKMVTHHCFDLNKSARKRREQYFGQWLPEPVLTSEDETYESVARGELLSYAMLVLLERLSPLERAVFVLREALGFDYSAIAELVGKGEANCRKLVSRARAKMGVTKEEFVQPNTTSGEWVRQFITALEQANVDAVISMLSEDAVLISDGGGKVIAALHPITSSTSVARFLLGLVRMSHNSESGMLVEMREINGETGVLIRSGDRIETAVLIQLEGSLIRQLYFVRNPDKLKGLMEQEDVNE
ncbi:RNA polymerase sigma-70 factor [Paenibacillus dakarensis]|uniref:RNA polymerase sigma-70 factor n=1 Tax=Paenibacillus dakarensis TaxID=1527293 RepID=UPI0006D595F8|nr:RNA polymerase sigma-70 factor [Paenibacillus dakarensis]